MDYEARHQCIVYEGAPSQKLALIGRIIQSKLTEGYRCLYLNSAPMVSGMRSTLSALGTDVFDEVSKGRLVLSSNPVTKNGEFDVEQMLMELEDSLDKALNDGFKGLWASGDMTWEFGAKQNFSKLMQYEIKLEELMGRRDELCGICQYHCDTLPKDAIRQSLLVHRSIVVSETLSRVNPHYLKSAWPPDVSITSQLDHTIALLSRTEP
jgi:hypothetical protein